MTDIVTANEFEEEPTDYQLFIDGDFVSSSSPDGLEFEFPYNKTTWATVPVAKETDVSNAVSTAQDVFEAGWGSTLPSQRRKILHQIADVVSENRDELARLTTLESGRRITEMERYYPFIEQNFRYYAGYCDKLRVTR